MLYISCQGGWGMGRKWIDSPGRDIKVFIQQVCKIEEEVRIPKHYKNSREWHGFKTLSAQKYK